MKRDIPHVFLDSNVWFSATYGSSNCQKILKAHADKKFIAVISHQVLEESIRNIKEKIPHMFQHFQKLISSYPPIMIADPETIDIRISGHVDLIDQPIFTSAIRAKVDYFVTGNIRDFNREKLKRVTGISILTPKEAIKLLLT